MNHTFSIVVYTNAKSLADWAKKQKFPQYLKKQTPKSIAKKKKQIKNTLMGLVITFIICVISAFLFPSSIKIPLLVMGVVGLLISQHYYSIEKWLLFPYEKIEYKDLGEKMLFNENGINIISYYKKQHLSYKYNKISSFTLEIKRLGFEGFFIDGKYKNVLLLLKWNINEEVYESFIEADVYNTEVRKQVIEILTCLYEKNIPVVEVDENRSKLYLLDFITPPSEKEPTIPSQIQNLIDEIGEA